MKNTAHFKWEEFINSNTAKKKRIDNTPSKEIESNIEKLMDFMEELRIAYKKPIYINSGYRCPELNKAVGGVANSAHQSGFACDIRKDKGLKEFMLEYLKDKEFDEFLDEGTWLHFALFSKDGRQRKKIMKLK